MVSALALSASPEAKMKMPDPAAASWIWSSDKSTTSTHRYFRKIIDLPSGVKEGKIAVTAVYSYDLYVNGKKLGWDTPICRVTSGIQIKTYDLAGILQPGRNVIAVDVLQNETFAGLLTAATIRSDSGEELSILSDSSWRCTSRDEGGWTTVDFKDETWKPAVGVTAKPPGQLNNYGKFAAEEILTHEFTKPPLIMKSGDMSVDYIRWAAGTLPPKSAPTRPSERWLDDPYMFAALKKMGYNTMFDYITWKIVEPVKDQFDWANTERNILGAHAAGFEYSACMWIHFMPDWYIRENQSSMLKCLQHNETTETPSIWAPETLAAYSRFYQKLSEKFPTGIDTISVALIGCYSEGGYPLGAAQWVVPTGHKHTDFWVGDDYARKNFSEHLRKKYRTLETWNEAWGTSYENFSEAEYPVDYARKGKKPRAYLDFFHWYAQSDIDFAAKIIDEITKWLPKTPINLLPGGTASLPQAIGTDGTGFVKLAGETAKKYGRDKIIVTVADRGGYYFWEKFYTTAAVFYGVRFISCPAGPGLTDAALVARIFSDASGGIDGYQDYPENIWPGIKVWKEYSSYLKGDKAVVETAVFLPTSESYLQEYPMASRELGLAPTLEGAQRMRDISDYDVVDERLVQDGALDHYRFLVLFQGSTVEKETMEKIAAWVKKGGVLIARDFGPMATVEGDTSIYQQLFPPSPESANLGIFRFSPCPASIIRVGSKADAVFLSGDWHAPEQFAAGEKFGRWTAKQSGLRLTVDPKKNYRLKISAMIPADKKGRILVNGKEIGTLASTPQATTEFVVPSSILNKQPLAELVFDVAPSVPTKSLRREGLVFMDGRAMGVFVMDVEWMEEGGKWDQPKSPDWQASVPWEALRQGSSKKTGKGITVVGPDKNLFQFCWLINQILHQTKELDPSLQSAVAIDPGWDGVQATLFRDRILYYNPTGETIQKQIRLRPEDFRARPQLVAPGQTDHTLTLQPYSLQMISLKNEPAKTAP
jgi:hypothetical protein